MSNTELDLIKQMVDEAIQGAEVSVKAHEHYVTVSVSKCGRSITSHFISSSILLAREPIAMIKNVMELDLKRLDGLVKDDDDRSDRPTD